MYFSLDFLKTHRIRTNWSNTGKLILYHFVVINSSTESVGLEKGHIHGFLEETNILTEEIITETVYEAELQEEKQGKGVLPDNVSKTREKTFTTSPTDIEVHNKGNLQDAGISEEHQKECKKLQ